MGYEVKIVVSKLIGLGMTHFFGYKFAVFSHRTLTIENVIKNKLNWCDDLLPSSLQFDLLHLLQKGSHEQILQSKM